ncbi:peptidoglycan DD-metalloendopeptidase family protein [Spiribacter sp. C176]|uniref:Peptidoglycan DD-metalloendopeptidase family protein n=1 Tax=Spiribacter salilacus TaxID=2664894 RepID=A0A6N7QL72_9GAMM|nr:peptidoglycan DD-metalloendopeptidase family protein [Spiribacter salilacus]
MGHGYFAHCRSRLFFAVIILLGVAGCAEFDYSADRAARESRSSAPSAKTGEYVVQKGDTLYAIAWSNNLDFKELARWNNITSPDRIRVGDRLRLTAPPGGAGEPASASASVRATPLGGQIGWQWPLQGQILQAYNANAVGKRGILIRGDQNAQVRAAAGGNVVYSGDGLRGYGNLIIIKHDDRFLTAYGYNEQLLVAEGDQVEAGQPVALIGGNARHPNSVHFEIRNLGKPVNPTDYLP